MKTGWILAIVGLLLAAVAGAVVVFKDAPVVGLMALAFGGPKGGFDPADQGPAPDYGRPEAWAALPTRKSLADLTPQGVPPRTAPAQVDVFFIHPTGYIAASQWTSRMDPRSSTEENTQWMLANQASAFNGCCDIYAPRYREAAIQAFFGAPKKRDQVLAFAYQDVERAFDYFLTHYSRGRPFIIASHSQGSFHAMTLLARRIDGTALRDRLVAAYVIGVPTGDLTQTWASRLKTLKPCDSPTDLHCVIHFATFADGSAAVRDQKVTDPMLCTNPLTWRNNGGRAEASAHQGFTPTSGVFTIKPLDGDKAKGVVFGPLGAPRPGLTFAECRKGMLVVQDLSGEDMGAGMAAKQGNYHGLDYPLFSMDIRRNAEARVEAYLAARVAQTSP